MAISRTGKPGRSTWGKLAALAALVVFLASSSTTKAQQPEDMGRPPRVRLLMNRAWDQYKRGDYDLAASLFAQVQASQNELSPTEQRDLKNFIQQNNAALLSQREGNTQLHQAEEALRLGKKEDAVRLVKTLTTNQYLAPTDRQKLAKLNENLRVASSPAPKAIEPGGKADEKSLLAAAREAMKRGDFDNADALAGQAEKVGPSMHFLPWADTPSKVRAEIAAARKLAAAPPVVAKDNPPKKKESTGLVSNLKKFFVKGDEKKEGVAPEGPPLAKGPDLPPPPPPQVGPMTVVPPPLPPPPSTVVKNDPPKPGPKSPSIPAAKQPDNVSVRQTTYPGNDANPPPGSAAANKALARKLVKDGYKALEGNDLDTARRLAMQARDLRPDLEWWEENPGRLLEDIQRRATGKAAAPAAIANNKPVETPTTDAHNLIKDARNLLQKDKIEEADKICVQAATLQPKGWGLFEDSPDKLRADIQKARAKRDREEAARLLVEARRLYGLGNLQEAKLKAYHAQKLHGPYTIWDLGDRPAKLLEEIQHAETKPNPGHLPAADVAKTGPLDVPPVAQNSKTTHGQQALTNKAAAPLVSGTAQAAFKVRAFVLLQEARDLQKKGLLIEARAKALEADQLKVSFGPEEDNPAGVLVSLAAQCERMVDQYLQRATDQVQNHPTDPTRFDKANGDINSARLLARTFQMDTMRIENKAQWLQQAANSKNLQPMAGAKTANDPHNVFQAANLPLVPPPVDSVAQRNRLLGLEKLEKARLELQHGNLAMARRLAEEAFNPAYGTQAEATLVLHSIDADEFNHLVNVANQNADAGFYAYNRGEFRQASSIFNGLDLRLVNPDKAKRIGELMNTPQMQPPALQLVEVTSPSSPGANPNSRPGVATATDLIGDDLTKSFRAMEEIQFQQLRERGMVAQKSAMELFKAGQKSQAVDVLKDYLKDLAAANFDSQQLALLKRPVENRMQQYRTVLAQEAIEKQVDNINTRWDESKHQRGIRKTQEEVAEQIKLYRALHKEGKYKEALAAARKAKELDPDNLAADAAIQITSIKIAQLDYEKGNRSNEELFLKSLTPGSGPYVDMTDPVKFDPDTMKRMQARENGNKGFWSPTRDAIERSIERRLNEPITITFENTPLHTVISDLQMMSGVNIVPDRKALQDANISLDQPLNLGVDKISLKSALNLLLKQVNLTYVIKDQVLNITTKEEAQGRMRMVTYSIADLVVPVENHPTPGIADMNTALARHLAGSSGMVNNTVSPYSPALGLPNGPSVSSQGSGVGSTFAMNPNGASPPAPVQARPPGQTMEDLLINLIQNTVAQNSWNNVGGQGTIQYYPLGMALVVNQTQEVQEDVAALLASLRRLQDLEVAIEMRLVSVSESFFERIGVNFDVNIRTPTSSREVDLVNGAFTPFGFVNRNNDRLNLVSGLTPAGTLTPDLNIPIKNSSFDFSVPPFGGYPGTLGADGGLSLGLAFLSDIQVFMFLEAAQGDRRMNVMQAPKLTVFNGQTANISVNDQQFFLTGVNINQSNAQIFFTPNNQPFPLGVTMQVTPVVSADRRFVRLNLTPNLTNLANANVPLIPVQIPVPQLLEGPGAGNTTVGQPVIFQMFFQQPTFTQIQLNTTVNVPDGGTVLLGGLKTMSEGRNEFGPPILSKIPYLSRLFKNVAYGREGQSLMIMVTPRIIINEEEEQIFLGTIPPIPRP